MLTIGDKFPDFSLIASANLPFEQLNADNAFITVTESSYRGQWLVVFFYPKDFTFVCPTEIVAFAKLCDEFRKRNAEVLGCSTDSEFVHWAWRKYRPELRQLPFPLMSDLKRELSGQLGILDGNSGVAHRALFIVDPERTIRFVTVTDPSVGRNPDEVLRVLDALQTGELCGCSWVRGQKTIDPQNAEI